MEGKSNLRKIALKLRSEIVDKELLDEQIYHNFCKINTDECRIVCAYCNTKTEAGTEKIINSLIENNKKVYLPVSKKNGEMDFFEYTGEFVSGMYGIKEPVSRIKLEGIPDLVLVPGVAFDLNGNRIGYGKGYYDRFLSKINTLKVGICFDEQVFDDVFALEHDIKMDVIITPRNIYRFD